MIQQLRIYDINPNLKDEFDERFRNHASRIMNHYGFSIIAMWFSETNDKTEFIYILQWDNERAMKNGWNGFMADNEWSAIKERTREKYGEMVLGKLKDQVLKPVDWFVPEA